MKIAEGALAMRKPAAHRLRAGSLIMRLWRGMIVVALGPPARLFAHGARTIALQLHRLDRDDEPEDDGNW